MLITDPEKCVIRYDIHLHLPDNPHIPNDDLQLRHVGHSLVLLSPPVFRPALAYRRPDHHPGVRHVPAELGARSGSVGVPSARRDSPLMVQPRPGQHYPLLHSHQPSDIYSHAAPVQAVRSDDFLEDRD